MGERNASREDSVAHKGTKQGWTKEDGEGEIEPLQCWISLEQEDMTTKEGDGKERGDKEWFGASVVSDLTMTYCSASGAIYRPP